MAVKIKGVMIEMGGDTYEVPPLSLGELERLQDRISAVSAGALDAATVGTIIEATTAAMRRNYPDMTREKVAELIDVGNMADVFRAVMDVSGLVRQEQQAGNAPAKTA